MNFQKLVVIRTAQEYIDTAFNITRKNQVSVSKMKSEINKAKKKELLKLTSMNEYLYTTLNAIIQTYPRVNLLSSVYQKLFPCYLDVDQYKKHLGAVRWARQRVSQISNIFGKKIKTSTDAKEITGMTNAYFGRICSVLNKINASFIVLETLRKKLKDLPDIKEEYTNVIIFGFPNVGKSTLLSKLTSAKPEIANYSFTTTKINMGYSGEFQIFDTPGTLNRFEKMNLIEKQAYIILKEIAHIVVYVFDPTELYPLKDQIKLYGAVKEMVPDAKIISYCSKSDIADAKVVDTLVKEFDCIFFEELNKIIGQR